MSKQKKYLAQKYGAVDSLARTSASPAKGADSKPTEAASIGCGTSSCESVNLNGYSSKMFPDFSLPRAVLISRSYSHRWTSSGMAWRGECWTLSFSESPCNVRESLLSDITEAHVHQRYYLSVIACKGILDRAERDGTKLPEALKRALTTGAGLEPPSLAHQQLEVGGQASGQRQNRSLFLPRRPTPKEAERLFGFRDNWTLLNIQDTKPSETP